MTGTALVTGGASGLGQALISQLLAKGMRVVCVDLVPPVTHANLIFIKCDLADRRAVNIGWAAILAAGPYDLVVLNAGVSATGQFETIPAEVYRRLVTLNTETPIRMASGLMKEAALRSGAQLVFVSSLSHFTGYPGAAVYAASKDALAVYAKSIRAAFRNKGVSVVSMYPGPLRTPHAERHAPAGADAGRRMQPNEAALILLAGTIAGDKVIIPGIPAKLVALAGRLFPATVTRWMRREIFEKLDRSVF